MFVQQRIVGALIGVAILLIIAYLVYRKKLTEERAAIWLVAGLLVFLLSVSGALQRLLGDLLGSTNMPATLLAVGTVFLLAISLDLSVQVTRHAQQAKALSQALALLEQRVSSLEPPPGSSGPGEEPGPPEE